MFEKFRKSLKSKPKNTDSGLKVKTIVAYVIFGAIILVFALFGITPDRMGSEMGGNAAVVNGQSISVGNFRRRLDMVERSSGLNLDQFPPAQREMFQAELRRRTLEDLIMAEGIFQKANKLGMTVSDEEVRRTITSIEAFQQDGRFRRQSYENYLTGTGQSAAQFEREIRKELLTQKLRALFSLSHEVSKEIEDGMKSLSQVQLGFDYASFSPQDLREKVSISKAQVQEVLSKEDAALRADFEQRKFEFKTEEKVKARHILVRSEDKVKEIQKDLNPNNFAEMAKKFSEDPGSKDQGGELGFFGRGRMDPDFEKAAFSQPIGLVGEPVKTQFGYHFILVDERQDASEPAFEEVKEKVAQEYLARKKVDEVLAALKIHVKEGNAKAVDGDLKLLGVQWKKAKDVSLGADQVPGLEDSEEAMKLLASRRGQTGLIPELSEWGGNYHLFDLKQWKSVAAPKEASQNAERTGDQLAGEAFQKWVLEVRDGLKIERNMRLVQR